MTTAVLTRPAVRTDRDGVPIRRVQVHTSEVTGRLERLAVHEAWAGMCLPVALAFTTGVLTYNLAPFIGWSRAFIDSATLVTGLTLAFIIGRALAPHIARGLHKVRRLDKSLAWWIGLTGIGRTGWLPPCPNLPLLGPIAVIPWHGVIARGGVIVRRTRLARPVSWVLLYDHSHVVAVARVTRQRWDNPGFLARILGPRVGLSARAYRTYTAGHPHACALEIDLAYTLTRPVTLAEVGITGPLGSHRYLGGKA